MAESNVIEVLIKGVDQASKMLADIEKRLAALEAQTKKTADATDKLTGTWAKMAIGVTALNQGLEFLNKVFEPTLAHFERGIEAAGQFQRETAILQSTLQVLGKNIPVQNLVEFSEEMAKANGVSSEAVLAAERQLVSLTKLNEDGVKQVVQGLLALSKVTDVDFDTAIRRSIVLLQGNTTQIIRGVDAINEHIPLVQRQAELLGYLSKFQQANIQSTDTYARTQRVLNNAIEDFHKALGSGIIERLQEVNPQLTKLVDTATDFVKAHPQLTAGIYGTAKALDELKGVLIALAALQLTGALGFLASIVANPAALAAIAAAAGIAAVGMGVLNNQLDRTADIDAAKNLEDTTKRIGELTKRLSDYRAEQVRGLGAIEAGRREKSDPTILALEDRIKRLQTAQQLLQQTADTGPTSHEAAGTGLPDILSKEEAETQRLIDKAQADLIKGRADAKAAADQFLFETTGDFNALLRSFATTQAGIAGAAKKQVDEQIKTLKESLDLSPAQEGRIRSVLSEQATLQIQQSQLQARKAQYDQEQKIIQTRIAGNKLLADEMEALANGERQRLEVLKAQNAPIYEQQNLLGKIGELEVAASALRTKAAQDERARLQGLIDNDKVRGDLLQQTINKIKEQNNLLIAEGAALDAISAKQQTESKGILDQAVTRNVQSRRADIQASQESEESRLDILQFQLKVLQDEGKPYRDILGVTAQIDDLERAILQKKIDQKQIEVDTLPAKIANQEATKGDLELAEAQLQRLKDSFATIGDGVRKATVDLHKQAEQMADDVAGSFVDTFVQYISNSESKISDVFASLGKTIVTEFLRAALSTLLTKPLEDMLKQWGANTTQGFTKFGVGGAFFGGIQDALGIGRAAQGSLPGAGQAIATGAAAASQNLPVPDFTGWTFEINQGLQGVDQTVMGGLKDLFDKSSTGFSEFFGGIGRLVSQSLEALGKAFSGEEGGGGGIFGSILGIFGSIAGIFGGGGFNSAASGAELGGQAAFNPLGGASYYAHGGYILPPNYAFAHGGYVLPQSFLKPFASGGMVTRGPVVGMVGEEGPELVARMKPAGASDWPGGGGQGAPQVIINGDITPRRPDMKPDEIIQIIANDAYNGGKISKAMTTQIKRNR